ncbi:uncharacterized protein IUM83_01341 [Phytophthora cinnamomi]|uniref:uncharacterized protein n=1 Tax=Phytophthora cinnamomi TaxID=4785 RepID=UPI00355A5318|nr:hypothetical protein IUM83_01341 [Phytophthora cinnamomi]
MDSSVLQPPNYHSLSDSVIGDVVSRSRRTQRDFVDDGASFYEEVISFVQVAAKAPLENDCTSMAPTLKAHSHSERKQGAKIDASTHQKSMIPREEPLRSSHRAQMKTTTKDDVVVRFREQRRIIQMRYRKKMASKTLSLESEVERLRNEVRTLEMKTIILGVQSNPKPWRFAVEYFHLFRYGLKPASKQVSLSQGSLGAVECTSHRKFLQSTMVPDVSVDTGYGIEEILRCWGLLACYYDDTFNIELVRLESDHQNSVVAYGKVYVTVSENTLRHAFPRLGIDEKFDPLGAKLLGRRLEMHGFLCFGWDHVEDRVSSVNYSFDMLTPLMQLLGSLEDATRVFDGALLTPDCKFVTYGS